MGDTSNEFIELVKEKLRKRFPHSDISVFEEAGSLKVSVAGIQVFDWRRIQEYLTDLPVPNKHHDNRTISKN